VGRNNFVLSVGKCIVKILLKTRKKELMSLVGVSQCDQTEKNVLMLLNGCLGCVTSDNEILLYYMMP
jgi:hypothetical protein